jgi:hypothetical protein
MELWLRDILVEAGAERGKRVPDARSSLIELGASPEQMRRHPKNFLR